MSNTPAEKAARAATFRLGNDVFVGLPPRLPVVYALQHAHRRSMGYTDADERNLAELERGDEVPHPTGKPSGGNFQAVCWATVAAWWQGYPLDLPKFHSPEVDRDVVVWGELAFEAFRPEHRTDLLETGKMLLGLMQSQLVAEIRKTQEIRGE